MRVREMQAGDYRAVQEVRVRNGLSYQSVESWEHMRQAPCGPQDVPLPIGWVLENDRGRMAGVHGTFPACYHWKGRLLVAAVAHSLAIDPEHRRAALALLAPYFRLAGVDFLLTTSASMETVKLFEFMKCQRMPAACYDRYPSWVVNYRGFVEAVLRKKDLAWARVLRLPIAAGLWAVHGLLRWNRFGRPSAQVKLIDDFDERFDRFWESLRRESSRLLAVRDRPTLAWHFRLALQERRVKIFVLQNAEGPAGYLVLVRQDNPLHQVTRYTLADLQVLHPREEDVWQLVAVALRHARDEQVDVLDAPGHDAFTQRVLASFKPHYREIGPWPCWYKPLRPLAGLDLASPEVWNPTPFDGDTTVWGARAAAAPLGRSPGEHCP